MTTEVSKLQTSIGRQPTKSVYPQNSTRRNRPPERRPGQGPADIVRKRNTDSAIRAESYRKLENLKQQCNVCKSTFIEYYDWQSGGGALNRTSVSWANSGWLDVGQPVTADILVPVLVTWPVPWGQPKKNAAPRIVTFPSALISKGRLTLADESQKTADAQQQERGTCWLWNDSGGLSDRQVESGKGPHIVATLTRTVDNESQCIAIQ